METVDITGISKSDLKWQIEHNQDKCTLAENALQPALWEQLKRTFKKTQSSIQG